MASVADKVVYTTGAVAIKVTMITDSRLSNVKLDRALTSLNDTLVRLEETRAGVNGKVHLLVSFRKFTVFSLFIMEYIFVLRLERTSVFTER